MGQFFSYSVALSKPIFFFYYLSMLRSTATLLALIHCFFDEIDYQPTSANLDGEEIINHLIDTLNHAKELDDALSSRWKYENLENLCRKWIEQEIKISQIKFLLQMPYYDLSQENLLMDYNTVYSLFDNIIAKKIKTIKVDTRLKSLESDFD